MYCNFVVQIVSNQQRIELNKIYMEPEIIRIKTKLKFTKSKKSNSWVGFVSFGKYGAVGVRETDEAPKKVCVVSYKLAGSIEPNVLYDVVLVPMTNNDGFVVIQATPHMFEAVISSTVIRHARYIVSIKFGHKGLFFDPLHGRSDCVRTIDGVINVLKYRKDVKNLCQVIDDFRRSAEIVLAEFINDGYEIKKDEVKEEKPEEAEVAKKAEESVYQGAGA